MGTFGVIVVALAVTGDSRVEPAAGHRQAALVTRLFLEAVRTGDDKTAAAMLTAKARKKTAEMNMQVAPPGSDTASFTIGKAVLIDGGTAYVRSAWTDLDNFGKPHTERVTWVLRRDAGAWRISGMLVSALSGKPPTRFDFEDPEGMLHKEQTLIEARQEAASKGAKDKGGGAAPPAGR